MCLNIGVSKPASVMIIFALVTLIKIMVYSSVEYLIAVVTTYISLNTTIDMVTATCTLPVYHYPPHKYITMLLRQLRARRALMQFKDVTLRTRRVL